MTTDTTNNVIKLAVPSPPRLMTCDVHLCADFSIELRLYDAGGNHIETLATGRVSKPEVIDLDELREAWDRWALQQAGIVTQQHDA